MVVCLREAFWTLECKDRKFTQRDKMNYDMTRACPLATHKESHRKGPKKKSLLEPEPESSRSSQGKKKKKPEGPQQEIRHNNTWSRLGSDGKVARYCSARVHGFSRGTETRGP